MRAGLERAALRGPRSYQRHFDTCLGCMACLTACPSGVKYDRLIEAHAPAGRATRPPIAHGSRVPPIDLRDLSSPSRLPRARVAAVVMPAIRLALADPRQAVCWTMLPARLARHGAAASRPVRIDAAPSRGGAHASLRCGPPARRIAPRMRAARVLSTRQRRDRARPRGGGLRRRDAGRAGLLRRADAACRPATLKPPLQLDA